MHMYSFWGWRASDGQRYLRTMWCGRGQAVVWTRRGWKVGSGQWSVGSWWGRIHETRYRWVGVALAQQQQY